MADNDDEMMNMEAIEFFRSLIDFKNQENRSTHPSNFAGHIGRHMRPELKKWFLRHYPENADIVNFFHKNDRNFFYDCISGDVSVRRHRQRFVTPGRLRVLVYLCARPDAQLADVSANVSEVEFFLLIFKHFVNSYELNKTVELFAGQLSRVFGHWRFERLFRKLCSIVANPTTNALKFETDLLAYLSVHYSSVFAVDKRRKSVRLEQRVIEAPLKRVSKQLDDQVYPLFMHLVRKYLSVKGPTDVDQLIDAIDQRHGFIVEHIFKQSQSSDDFHLLDFVLSFPEVFTYTRAVAPDDYVLRIIGVNSAYNVSKAAESVSNVSNECSVSMSTTTTSEERFDISDEIYYDSEEDLIGQQLVVEIEAKENSIRNSIDESPSDLSNNSFANTSITTKPKVIDSCVDREDNRSSDTDWEQQVIIYAHKPWNMESKIRLLAEMVRNLKLEFDRHLLPRNPNN